MSERQARAERRPRSGPGAPAEALDPAALEAALDRAPMLGSSALWGEPERPTPTPRAPRSHADHHKGQEPASERPVVPARTANATPGRPTHLAAPSPDRPSWTGPAPGAGLTGPKPVVRGAGLAARRRAAHESTLPVVDEEALSRLRGHLVAGLRAAGFERPRLKLEVKPYTGLRASLEQDRPGAFQAGEALTMRLSDGYVLAPDQALQGLGASLGVRMFHKRRRVPELASMLSEYYDLWQRSQDARELQSRLRKARGRKQGRGPDGDTYDLVDLTGRVVAAYLGGRIRPVQVTWSTRASYTVLGHHDGDLDTIVLSKALDHPDVPESVVAYVLYHELLHHVMGIQEGPDHARRLHPPAFRRREQRFRHWSEGDAYLSAMCGRRKPIPRHRARSTWHALWDEDWQQPVRSANETRDLRSAASLNGASAPIAARRAPTRGRGTPA